jgi:hypothetical protein
MMQKHWKVQGFRGKHSFDPVKYWAYGCHCVYLGANAINQIGHGVPKDEMDTSCRGYTVTFHHFVEIFYSMNKI